MTTIAYIHIPKCAGTTMVSVVNRLDLKWWHVPAGVYVAEYDAFIGNYETSLREDASAKISDEYDLILGHFSQRDVIRSIGSESGLRFATTLRDPVERLVSEYYYSISKTHNGADATRRLFPTFRDFVTTNTETEVIARFLESYRGEPADRIADRLVNLYAFVGFTDRLTASVDALAKLFGRSPPAEIGLANVTADKPATIDSDLVEIIHDRNARDVAIFNAVKLALASDPV
ncbi:sulfotransferase family 2 domain-containing protein [Sphingomonas glacialis]|uniref:Sulfotransferase family protein n=1 Tax=Sphingomonas glacialis TaxID=658225 RepID=A0A502G298_9SPHN|nr:sulfotransferase family 2 domain-containing protein [Sphingomonas glacialis]TPG55173.1 hypothetical protein EAH76_11495 [Sphingomonas glacialis]